MQLAKAFVDAGVASPEAAKRAERAIAEARREAKFWEGRKAQIQDRLGPEIQEILDLEAAIKAASEDLLDAAKADLREALHRHGYVRRCDEHYRWWEHPACSALDEDDTFPPGTVVSMV